ncbi:MAG: 7-cyano-7-deazaguanine synthase QueC [Armatimonadetes bacterium]|nr:7-cyano-7-deazaguanine synthase QueC [Armatimonadota bacterium]
MKKGVVLLSGGLDSATVVAMAKDQGYEIHALTVIYGQRHDVEIEASRRVAAQLGVASHRFVSVDLGQIGGSALTAEIDVPKGRDESTMESEIPVTYVPARNTIMLSIALGLAEVLEAEAIFAGMNAVDYSGYPDCRPEYVDAFARMAALATKAGVEGNPVTIITPLMNLRKADIIREGIRLGVDYSLTHSCYDPVEGRACGECDACLIRIRAFSELGMTDPALA